MHTSRLKGETDRLRPARIEFRSKFLRAIWGGVRLLFFRPTPVPFHFWRCFILRCFGAKLGQGVHVYPSVRIWAPWNLKMDDRACLSPFVDCYNVGRVSLGADTTVSQYSFLCSATRDHSTRSMALLVGDITLGKSVWLAADVFIGPGVSIGDSTVVLARSSVFHDLGPNLLARGNPVKAEDRNADVHARQSDPQH